MKITDLKPKKILIIRPDAIGDCIFTIPMINSLKKKWPESKIYFLASPYAANFIKKHPVIDFIITDYLDHGRKFSKYYKLYKEIRSYKFDIVIDSFNFFSYALLSFLARIPIRVGDKHKIVPNFLYNYRANQKYHDLTSHQIERNLALLEPLGIQDDVVNLDLPLPNIKEINPEIFKTVNNAGKYVCIHLVTGGGNKPWLLQGYISVINKIIQENICKIILLGLGPEEEKIANEIINNIKINVINLVNKTTIEDLIWVIAKSQLFIGVDSGPMHMASMLKIPILAISTTNFVKHTVWGPYQTNCLVVRPEEQCGKVCYFISKCQDDFCLKAISEERVFENFIKIYNQKNINTHYDNLLVCLKASLNVLLIINNEEEREQIEKVIKYLYDNKYFFHIIITCPKIRLELSKKNIRLYVYKLNFSLFSVKTFVELFNFIVKNDIGLVHLFGKGSKAFFKLLFLLTALKQYIPPKLYINDKRFINFKELIDKYIEVLRS